MTNKKQPEALRNKYLTVIYRDIKPGDDARDLIMHPKMAASSWSHVMDDRDRLHAEIEALRTGYAAARLEIESLRAAQPAYNIVALSPLPSPDHSERIYGGHGNEIVHSYYTDHQMREYARQEVHRAEAAWQARASHGQAPAQAAPAAVAGPSDDAVMDRTRDLASSGRWPSDWADAYRRGYADAAPTAQPSPQQEVSDNRHRCRLLTRAELDALGAKAEGMDGNQWDMWVQEQFARANGLKIEGGNYDWE